MNKNNKQKFIDSLFAIKMTEEEKSVMHDNLRAYITADSINPVKSPYSPFIRVVRRSFAVGLGTLILLGSISQPVSANALPGEFFYPVKIMYEEIESATKNSSEKKIYHEIKRTQERIEEATTLLSEKQHLSTEDQESIARNIRKHTQKLKEEIKAMKTQNPVMALELNNQVKKTIKDNTELLRKLNTESDKSTKQETQPPVETDVQDQEEDTEEQDTSDNQEVSNEEVDGNENTPSLPEINELDISLDTEPALEEVDTIQKESSPNEAQKLINLIDAEVQEVEEVSREVSNRIVRDMVTPVRITDDSISEVPENDTDDNNNQRNDNKEVNDDKKESEAADNGQELLAVSELPQA